MNMKRAILMLVPFLLLFLYGFAILLQPKYDVPVIDVVDRFTKRERTSMRSSHYRTVPYAVVTVEYNEQIHEVTVRDNTWLPVKSGDNVLVRKNLLGKITEYRSEFAYEIVFFSVFMEAVMLVVYWAIGRRRKA